MAYASYYRVLSPKGRVLIDNSAGAACFAQYNLYEKVYNGTNVVDIKIYTHKSNPHLKPGIPLITTPFSLDQVKDHIVELVKIGFPIRLIDTGADYYQIEINEADCINQSHMRLTIDFLRICWENPIIMEKMHGLPKSYRDKHNYFMLLQAVSIHNRGTGHSLPCQQYNFCLSSDEVNTFLRTNKKHGCGSVKVWFAMMDKKLKYQAFVEEVRLALAGRIPAKVFDTLSLGSKKELAKPSLSSAVRKIVRRKTPVMA